MSRRYLLDSGPTGDCIFRRRGVFERAREARNSGAKIGIGMPILGELVGGVEASTTREENWPILCRGLSTFVLCCGRSMRPPLGNTVAFTPSSAGSVVRCNKSTSRLPRSH
jgi:hypothetical protein